MTITHPTDSVIMGTGLALHPTSGEVFAMLTIDGQTGRVLATINTVTGEATLRGNTGDKFAAITFNSSGFLYGITGDGANVGETLFAINALNGVPTFVMNLGNGDDGETIAYNPDNGLLFHASGIDGGRIFESTNSVTAPSNIPLAGSLYEEATALVYNGNGNFILASWSSFFNVTTTGVVTALDSANFQFSCKGLIPANTSTTIKENLPRLSATIKVYPNPSTGKFTVYRNPLLSRNNKLFIYDLRGNIILEEEIDLSGKIKIDLSDKAKGIYYLKIDSNQGSSWGKLLVE